MTSEINSIEAKHLASFFIEKAVNNAYGPSSVKGGTKNESEEKLPEREVWGSKAEFLLSCVGLSVGIGNVWRFPYMAYQNGGGAFLLPYVILLIFVGKPMYFLEVALGQYSSLGPMAVWRCFPLAKGVGVAMVIVSIVVSVYYNVVMSYTLFYMAQSFRSVLPWTDCFEWWGADNSTCYVRTQNKVRCPVAIERLISSYANQTHISDDNIRLTNSKNEDSFIPLEVYRATLSNCTNATQTASEQFWERYVLNISSGIDDIGTIKWDLALCVLASWTIIFLCLRNGVKSSGKVVYFTATFPYVVLFTMLIYGVTLDGASDGIYYFFVPNWESLLNIGVWRKAAEQLFYSLSISWGGLILFGSYNQFNNKVYRDAMFVSSLDFFTCFISGIVIFAVLGNMAKNMGLQVEDVVKGGQGLAFVAYPEALAGFWFPQLWSFLFFLMLFLLGVDSEVMFKLILYSKTRLMKYSEFAYLETFLTSVYDEYPKLRNRKTLVTFLTCTGCFFIGLPCVTQGGQYVFNLMDNYCGSFSILFVAICELMALMWGYGKNRLCDDFEFMLGFRPGFFWQSSWLVISPVVLTFIFVFGLAKHVPITYNGQRYPSWAENLGWFLALLSMVQIPLWAIYVVIQNRKNLKKVLLPSEDWGPGDVDIQKELIEQTTCSTIETAFDNPSLEIKPEIL